MRLVLVAMLGGVALQGATPLPPTTRDGGIEYSVVSIVRKGTSMGYGNARITAPAGHEIVELKLRMQALGQTRCCAASKFVLETTDGKAAEAVWGEMNSERSTTFALQFIAPKAARFRVFKVNAVTIDLASLASEKPPEAGASKE